jgi:hypothetical protein
MQRGISAFTRVFDAHGAKRNDVPLIRGPA